ncbi:MAG: hypothetical protein PVG70_15850, partial [Desulfobacterales bacterium]
IITKKEIILSLKTCMKDYSLYLKYQMYSKVSPSEFEAKRNTQKEPHKKPANGSITDKKATVVLGL